MLGGNQLAVAMASSTPGVGGYNTNTDEVIAMTSAVAHGGNQFSTAPRWTVSAPTACLSDYVPLELKYRPL